MVKRIPMLDVPGWLDSAIAPNDPMVVSALNTTARGVLVAIARRPSSRSRSTRWMAPATPSPKSSGNTITLAKLKGRPNRTEAATVSRAARVSGAKTRKMSLGFRNRSARSRAMETTAMRGRVAEGGNHRITRLQDDHGRAGGAGGEPPDRLDESFQGLPVMRVFLRIHRYPGASVGGDAALPQALGQVIQGHRARVQGLAQGVEPAGQRRKQPGFELGEGRVRPGSGEGGKGGLQAAGGGGRGAVPEGAQAPELAQQQGGGGRAVSGRLFQTLGRQRRGEKKRHGCDDAELLVLARGHVVGEGFRPFHQVQAVQPMRQVPGGVQVGAKHGDRIGAGTAVPHQIEEGGDRFRPRVLQVQGIEIEARPGRHQGGRQPENQGPRRQRPGRPPDQSPPSLHPAGGEGRQGEQGGQHRQVGEQGDEHSRARDQAELGQPQIIRGQEGIKGDGRRHGGQRQGAADAIGGLAQGRPVVPAPVDPFLVAQPEVDAEIDAQADEQDREGHRDQVQLADGGEGEAGGPDQPHDQGDEDGRGQARRPEAGVKQADDQGERQHGGQSHAFLDALQLLGRQRRRPGQAYPEPVAGVQARLGCEPADGLHGLLSRPE